MDFGFIKDVTKTVISSASEYSDDDFFTSGLKNAQRHYYETKQMYTVITFVLIIICVLIMLAKYFIF